MQLALNESRDGRGVAPGGVVQPAVDDGGSKDGARSGCRALYEGGAEG